MSPTALFLGEFHSCRKEQLNEIIFGSVLESFCESRNSPM